MLKSGQLYGQTSVSSKVATVGCGMALMKIDDFCSYGEQVSKDRFFFYYSCRPYSDHCYCYWDLDDDAVFDSYLYFSSCFFLEQTSVVFLCVSFRAYGPSRVPVHGAL